MADFAAQQLLQAPVAVLFVPQQRLQPLDLVATAADLIEVDLLLLFEVEPVFARQRIHAVVMLLDQLRQADAAFFAERLVDLVVRLNDVVQS